MTDDELIAAMLAAYEAERFYLAPNLRMRAVLDMVRLHDARHRPTEPDKPKRVPVQVSLCKSEIWAALVVIANDGTMWRATPASQWTRFPDLPQG